MHFNKPGRIKVFIKDPNKKNLLKICKEVAILWLTKKEVPMYYFKHLYRKDIMNYRDYLGPKLGRKIHASKRLHKQEYTSILNNKLNFSLYCEKNGIPTPKLIGHNFGGSFFSLNGIIEITNIEELVHFFENVFSSIDVEAIFFRPLALNGGKGCFRLDREKLRQQLQVEYENLLEGDYAHTEAITQHTEIDAIYSKSINTLRILTHIDNGNVDIITSFMRFGTGGCVVDNGGAGGLSVGIDQESGTLKRTSYLDMEFGGGELEKHPDTGFVFKNFKIPGFKEACELAKSAAKHIPNGIIGWDIALTPTGPTIIEGNEDASLFVCDVLSGGLLKNPHMQKVLARI